ncbi:right-handed parallel beta-helix repeat-containing protein [Humitalea sp. 24SJ18S-53]|uniref:right-handed parallel beta-helix repeat-containing protein n=1 Tax=Humitalea sp. 24SJ18S-53 TaxID=3422307 RepID=UPI003D6680E2
MDVDPTVGFVQDVPETLMLGDSTPAESRAAASAMPDAADSASAEAVMLAAPATSTTTADIAMTMSLAPASAAGDGSSIGSDSPAQDSAVSLAPATIAADAAPSITSDAPATQQVVFIDPSAAEPGDGSAAHPFSSWIFVSLVAGNIYLQKAGTVLDGPLVLHGEGTEAAPILIGAYGTGAAPVVRGSIMIENSAHLTLSGFDVQGSQLAGIAVQHGSHNIIIVGNNIHDNSVGVWFSSDSGGGNLLINNTISGNAIHGIAFNKTDHRANPTLVADNVVTDNGSHGIEINANGIVVLGNAFSGNGHSISGSSGIHVYGGVGQADGFGNDNIIVSNTITDTHEAGQGYDGNGIQLDQFTARNIVVSNTASGNDGAGIILFDSAMNIVIENTLTGNALDRTDSRHWQAELILASDDRAAPDLTASNLIMGNIITPRDADVLGIWVDTLTADNANQISSNSIAAMSGDVGLNMAFLSTSPVAGGGDDIWGG